MAETVECAECGARYDSNDNAFCPRCGATGQRADPVQTLKVARNHPRRRRVQAAGIVLVMIGAFGLVQAGALLFNPPSEPDAGALELLADTALASGPGGDLRLDLAGSFDYRITYRNGTLIENGTAVGSVTLTDLPVAFVEASVMQDGRNWSARVYAPVGDTVSADVATHDGEWVAPSMTSVARTLGAFWGLFAAFIAFGGVSAMRRRHRRLAIAAASLPAIFGLVILFVIPLGGILLMVPPAVALVLLILNKDQFD